MAASIDITESQTRAVWFASDERLVLSPYARGLFQEYSKVPAADVTAHILKVREEAWKVHPYPCIGSFRFLDFASLDSPAFPTVLEKLKSGSKYLEMGCCFAQELRTLVHAGVPSENLYGADLRADFIDLSYELFQDKDTLKSTFFHGDIFDLSSFRIVGGDESDPLPFQKLKGNVDIISARSFLHVFGTEDEFKAACRLVEIASDSPGTMIIGRQVGSKAPRKTTFPSSQREVFRHGPETFKSLWNKVGHETNTKWDVQAQLVEIPEELKKSLHQTKIPDLQNRAWLEFVITRN